MPVKPLNDGAPDLPIPPGLVVRRVQLELSIEVCAAIEEELNCGGFTAGMLCIGPSPIYAQSVFILWMGSEEESFSETILRALLADPECARTVFRGLVSKWKMSGGS
jgi:hypothetical protein